MTNNMTASRTLCFLFFISTTLVPAAAAKIPYSPKAPTQLPPKVIPPKFPPVNPFCPRDVLKLGACANVLGGAVKNVVGDRLGMGKCCALLEGLTDAEAAACLCTVIKETALGITTEWSVALSVLVSSCKKQVPDGFKCF